MPRTMLIVICILTVGLISFGAYTSIITPVQSEAAQSLGKQFDRRVMKDAHDRISLMNLLSGLWLSKEQYQRIVPIVEDASPKVVANRNEIERLASDSVFQANLQTLHDTLLRSEQVSDEKRREIEMTSGRLHGLVKETEGIIYEAGKLIKAALNENQLYLARTFEPCLFLPDDPNSPTLVGQVRPDGRGLEMLTHLRNVPLRIYNHKIDRILDKTIERQEAHLHHDFDPKAERERLRKLFDEVRSMSDKEFEVRKAELIDELFLLPTVENEMKYNSYTEGLTPKDRTALKLGGLFTGEGKPEIIRTYLAVS